MRNAHKIFCIIALLGLVANAQLTDLSWKNSSFAVPPQIILEANNVPNGGVLTPSTVLLPGPVSGTNTLLSTYLSDGKFTFFRQILDVTTAEVLHSFDPIETSLNPEGVKYSASLDGYLAFANTEFEDERFSQVYVYKMLLNGTTIERLKITDNDNGNTVFKVLSIFNDNINFIVAYSIGTQDPGSKYFEGTKMVLKKLNMLDNSISVEFPVTKDSVEAASCDSLPYSSTAYCIFKQNKLTRGAIISITNTFAQSPVNLMPDTEEVTYNPLYLAGVNGYYVALMSGKQGDQISLIGKIVAHTLGPTTINKWKISNDFVSFSITSVQPYFDGFMIFYTITDAYNDQYWYYQAFTKEFNVMLSPTLIGTIPSTYMLTTFSIAPSSVGGSPSDAYFDNHYRPVNTDNGNPLGFLAVQASPDQTVAAWYGQIVAQTIDTSLFTGTADAPILKPLILLALTILGFIFI